MTTATTAAIAGTAGSATEADGVEAFDLYGNWKVKNITLNPPPKPFGIQQHLSKFKIIPQQGQYVLVKKQHVEWNGTDQAITLTEINPSASAAETALFNARFRLKATVTFGGGQYEVALGSDDNGEKLKIDVVGDLLRGEPGGTGTAGRGG